MLRPLFLAALIVSSPAFAAGPDAGRASRAIDGPDRESAPFDEKPLRALRAAHALLAKTILCHPRQGGPNERVAAHEEPCRNPGGSRTERGRTNGSGVARRGFRVCNYLLTPVASLRDTSRGFGDGHAGIDLVAPHGTPIRAAAGGTIVSAGWDDGYGNFVDIRHGYDLTTRYAHMSVFAAGIAAGTKVRPGFQIGSVGDTGKAHGAHLHFEVRLNGQAVDPKSYLARPLCGGARPPHNTGGGS